MLIKRVIIYCLLAFYLPSLVAAKEIDTALRDGWPVAEPADAGLDPVALVELALLNDSGVNYSNVHAVLIEHKGRLFFERYWAGEDLLSRAEPLGFVQHGPTTRHNIRSITKSVTSLLLGIALGRSAEDALARTIASFFPDGESLDGGRKFFDATGAELTNRYALAKSRVEKWVKSVGSAVEYSRLKAIVSDGMPEELGGGKNSTHCNELNFCNGLRRACHPTIS